MASSLSLLILNTMVSWRSIWCNSFCGVFVGIWWTSSLWSVISFYIHGNYLSFFDLLYAWSLIASYFFSDIWVLSGQLDLFILQWEEVLCSGFDLTVLDPSDRKGTDTYVSLLLRIKRRDLISAAIDKWILSTSCHHSYCITPFFHELNTLDACWIAVDVWSNSSRCSQESIY